MLYLHNNGIRSSGRGVSNNQIDDVGPFGNSLGILIRRLEENVSRVHDSRIYIAGEYGKEMRLNI